MTRFVGLVLISILAFTGCGSTSAPNAARSEPDQPSPQQSAVRIPVVQFTRAGDLLLDAKIKIASCEVRAGPKAKSGAAVLENVSQAPVKALVHVRWMKADGSTLVTRGTQKGQVIELRPGEKVGVTSQAPADWVAGFGLDVSDRVER